ncbi:hypothetical protein QYF36_017520 [Acer negundo]|nr:hypothetical protein QYF36_017520 [Acer negundo]
MHGGTRPIDHSRTNGGSLIARHWFGRPNRVGHQTTLFNASLYSLVLFLRFLIEIRNFMHRKSSHIFGKGTSWLDMRECWC